jgi:hypothetical protein
MIRREFLARGAKQAVAATLPPLPTFAGGRAWRIRWINPISGHTGI